MNIEFNQQLKQIIKEESLKNNPRECCGLIYIDSQSLKFDIYKCKNCAENKQNEFLISPRDYITCGKLGKIVACYHSHTNDNIEFSEIDKNNSNANKINYILYNVKEDKYNFYSPENYNNNYIGKPFVLGRSDCFTLMQEYALREHNIKINFPKRSEYPRDIKQIRDLYEKSFEESGFMKLDKNIELQKSDGIMMLFPSVSELYPTHAAVYIDNNTILHQPFNSFSCVNIYDSFYKKHTKYVLRHRSLFNGKG